MQYQLGADFSSPLNPCVRAAGIILAYLLGVFLLAALAAPWVWQLGQWAAAEIPAFKPLGAQPFHRYLNRCLLVIALAGLWPVARAFQLSSRRALGLAGEPAAKRRLGLGAALGLGSLLVVALAMIAANARQFSAPGSIAALVFNATLSAIAVAALEEIFFRGLIFGALRQACSLPVALIASSAFYSAAHFLARVEHTGAVDWTSGFTLLPRMLAGVVAPENLAPAGLTLAIGGAALALAYQRTGSLWFAIGLHAGWVFWLKIFKSVATPGSAPTNAFWGTEKLLDGWFTLLVMVAVLAAVAKWLPAAPPSLSDDSDRRPDCA